MTLYYNYLYHVEAKILFPLLSLMAPHGSAHSPYPLQKMKINSLKKKYLKKT